MQGFSKTSNPVNEHRLLTRESPPRIAVPCAHDLSYLQPGDRVHTYDKLMALAAQAPVVLFAPTGYVSRGMMSRMKVVQVTSSGGLFRLTLALALFAHRDDYDCIYARDPLLMFFAAPMKLLGKALILEMNGIPSLETEIRRRTRKVQMPGLTPFICTAIRLAEFIAIQCADLVLPVTEKMKATIAKEFGADPRKIVVVPNAVDTRVFRPLEDERREVRGTLGLGKETAVLYLGTFSHKWRMSELFFKVVDSIRCRRSDILFLIVGSGPLLEEVRAAFRELATSDVVRWVGSIDHGSVPSYINASDIYVYDVVRVESKLVQKQGLCPTKVLEAMACGKPIIAFKEAELEALLLKSEGGFCVSSLEEMESLILRLADCADLARSIGANARRYVELNHDLTLLTRLTVELIRGVVSSKQTQSRRNRACVV